MPCSTRTVRGRRAVGLHQAARDERGASLITRSAAPRPGRGARRPARDRASPAKQITSADASTSAASRALQPERHPGDLVDALRHPHQPEAVEHAAGARAQRRRPSAVPIAPITVPCSMKTRMIDAARGAHRDQDRDVLVLLHHHQHQRRHDVERRHRHDQPDRDARPRPSRSRAPSTAPGSSRPSRWSRSRRRAAPGCRARACLDREHVVEPDLDVRGAALLVEQAPRRLEPAGSPTPRRTRRGPS